ncbi:MAG TPA: hypothetical protein VFX22_06395, partial [Candidatus Kapabacteria bacterium]|nr:hypothetical protein [Candidatus Kapabacteria bacterium]
APRRQTDDSASADAAADSDDAPASDDTGSDDTAADESVEEVIKIDEEGDLTPAEEETLQSKDEPSDVVSRTRAELAELDDLEV